MSTPRSPFSLDQRSRSGALAIAPACAPARPQLARETHDLAAANTRPILVVESDEMIAKALVEQLASDGYQAELARTAEHARARAKWSAPRLVLLGDCSRGSLELLEEIRRRADGRSLWSPEVPIIVIGTSANELDMLRAFETGADDFLARPTRYLELRSFNSSTAEQSFSSKPVDAAIPEGVCILDLSFGSILEPEKEGNSC